MRISTELRSALGTIGNAAVGVGLGLSVLWVAVVMSQFATSEGSAARSAPSASASTLVVVAASTTPTTAVSIASIAPASSPATPVPTASPTDPPTATPTPLPSAASLVTVDPYSNGGRRYAALTAPVGHVYLATIGGTVKVQTYQFIEGEVRVGSFVPSLPFFPYVTVESADRRVIYRPGALNADTEMLIKDGERAQPGTPLFKTVGEGASSWRTFYDRRVAANVIVSVVALPSGAEVDPVRFLSGP